MNQRPSRVHVQELFLLYSLHAMHCLYMRFSCRFIERDHSGGGLTY